MVDRLNRRLGVGRSMDGIRCGCSWHGELESWRCACWSGARRGSCKVKLMGEAQHFCSLPAWCCIVVRGHALVSLVYAWVLSLAFLPSAPPTPIPSQQRHQSAAEQPQTPAAAPPPLQRGHLLCAKESCLGHEITPALEVGDRSGRERRTS